MPFINTFEELAIARTRREAIETALELRFPAETSQLMHEIRQIHDLEELRKVLRGAMTASSPEELRKLWADSSIGKQPQE